MDNWKRFFEKGKEVILATSSLEAEPNANIAISLGFVGDMIMFADCQMMKTISNLRDNPRISLISGYFRVRGTVEISDVGEHFESCIKENEGSGYMPKNAIMVKVSDVFDLDKCEKIL